MLYLPVPARSVPFSRSTRNCVSHTTYLLGRKDGTPLFLGARHGVGMRESTASEHGNLHCGGAEGETGEGHTWSHPAHTVARKRRTDIAHVAVIVRAAPGAAPTRQTRGAAVRVRRVRRRYGQDGRGQHSVPKCNDIQTKFWSKTTGPAAFTAVHSLERCTSTSQRVYLVLLPDEPCWMCIWLSLPAPSEASGFLWPVLRS